MQRGEEGACVVAVARDALGQGVQTVVFQLVMQFVQQFHANDFTVGLPTGQALGQSPGPIEAMGFEQHTPAVHVIGVERGPHAEVGHTGQGR